MNRKQILWGITGILALVSAFAIVTLCVCLAASLLTIAREPAAVLPSIPDVLVPDPVLPSEPTAAPATPSLELFSPTVDEAQETLDALREAIIPISDLHDLAIRFRGVPADTPRVRRTTSPDYPVGTRYTFNVSNLDTNETFSIEAVLVYKTPHVYMWIEEGLQFNIDRVRDAADLFETHTYPTTREFFGSEWTPGVDGDPHLSILHARNLGRTVAGYFSSADSFVREVRPDSNEMEMFYIHIDRGMQIGDPFYNGVLAHEFQHMIHWNNDRNETTWLNEGCSELAVAINDRTYPGGRGYYDVGGSERAYLRNPDTQLTTWPEVESTGSAAPHYGAAYLFMSYFLDRFGEEATKALVAHPENGMDSVDAVLREDLGLTLRHEDLFADWVIANLINDPSVAEGQFAYEEITFTQPAMDRVYRRPGELPDVQHTTVGQYAVDYIEINHNEPVTFRFSGSEYVRLMNTEARSGKYLWWSNREDESNTRLSRVVDLTEAQEAGLDFWSWYHIEQDWDYAYVVVGTTESGVIPENYDLFDIRWQILSDQGLGCTTENPNNGNLGCGITGQSNGWEYMQADLTPFVGQEIILAFEYITDAAVNQAGLALDDIRIVIDGVLVLDDDVEEHDPGWVAEGFVRHANILPQNWIVQWVLLGEETQVERLVMLDATAGEWTIPLSRTVRQAVLSISAVAPVTTERAPYSYGLRVAEP